MTSLMITSEKLDGFGQAVTKSLPDAVTSFTVTPFAHGEPELTVHVKPETIIAVLTHLRDDPGCQFYAFIDITAVDWPQREKRFDVVYHLLSPTQNARIRIKIEVGEDETVASATGVFLGANWFEREVYDLYGIVFTGHPDMRRILTDYGFDGHPLRKDFPTSRSGSSTARCSSRRSSATSISSRRGKGRTTCCRATRRPGRAEMSRHE
jgi:NADH-quinone oxidoreductase subunit C